MLQLMLRFHKPSDGKYVQLMLRFHYSVMSVWFVSIVGMQEKVQKAKKNTAENNLDWIKYRLDYILQEQTRKSWGKLDVLNVMINKNGETK